MSEKQHYEFAPFRLNADEHLLLRDGQLVPLAPKAVDLLLVLLESNGRLISKDELMKLVWPDTFVEEANLSHHIFTIRKALEDDKQRAKYIETIPRRGYRFIAPVTKLNHLTDDLIVAEYTRSEIVVEEGLTAIDGTPGRIASSGDRLKPRSRWTWAAAAVVLIGLSVAIAYWMRRAQVPDASGTPIRSIAVLPFKPLVSSTRNEDLEMGMAESMITRLGNLRQVVVRPTSSVRKYTGLEQDAVAAGRELQVDSVLDASIQRSGDRLRIVARLVSVRDGSLLWSDKFDERLSDIFLIQDRISERITDALRLKLSGPEKSSLAKRYTDNVEAYQLYLQGRQLWNKRSKESFLKAIQYFEQAISRDANYALAYSGIADSYYLLGYLRLLDQQDAFRLAREAAVKAIKIDDDLAEAHTSLARIKDLYDRDWRGAEQEYKRAIEINPNYATARHWYSRHLLGRGEIDRSITEATRSQEIDPVSLSGNANLGEVLYYARRYDEALKHFQKTREIDPSYRKDFVGVYHYLIYMRKEMYEPAIDEYAKVILLAEPDANKEAQLAAALRAAYRTGGVQGLYQKEIELVKKEARQNPDSPMLLAESYTRLGDSDQAVYWLSQAANANHPAVYYLLIDPDYESLRSDQRFQKLLSRVSLAK